MSKGWRRGRAIQRAVMYEYECLDCGFRWQQSLYSEFEYCVSCSGSNVEYRGSEERALEPLTVMRKPE